METRLKTGLWVKALIRRCEVEAVPAMVVRKGDKDAGTVLVKVNLLDGTGRIYAPARRGDGSRIWMEGAGGGLRTDQEIESYIERQRQFDSDLWVIEVEDPKGRHFLDEPVES